MYRLTVLPPEGEPLEHDLESEVVIGRSIDCGLTVTDSLLSRKHARVFRQDGELMVEDLGSSNGTLVNGALISEATPIKHGDAVQIAGTHISVSQVADTDATAEADSPAEYDGVTSLRPLSELLPQDPEETAERQDDEDALKHYAARLKLLNEVHRALGLSAELDELLELVLDGAFEHLGPENVAIYLKDEEGELERAAARSLSGEDSDGPVSRTLVHEVVDKGQAALAVDVQADQRFAGAQSIIATGARSLLAAPLLDSEGCMGMIALSSNLQKKVFNEEDMELLASLASVAALRIRNVSLAKRAAEREKMAQDIAMARRVQESVLPKTLPDLAGYELEGYAEASRGVSGDFYQIMERSDGGECVIMIVDVSGKGVPASLLSVGIDTALSALVNAGLDDPAEILSEANALLYKKTPPAKFATAFFMVLSIETGRVRYVNAGHNPPLLIKASGAVSELEATGFPIAMAPEGGYEAQELTLEPGDLIAMFTDGIVEAENPDDEEYQLDRLAEAILTAVHGDIGEIRASIERDLDNFVQGVPFRDDRTLVLLRRSKS